MLSVCDDSGGGQGGLTAFAGLLSSAEAEKSKRKLNKVMKQAKKPLKPVYQKAKSKEDDDCRGYTVNKTYSILNCS